MQQKISIKDNIIKYNPESLNREIEDILIERFEGDNILESTLEDLHDPYLLKDMDKAVKRVKEAKENEERIMIFGDYDVD